MSPRATTPSPAANVPRVRQTQRLAADRLIDALRKTTAVLPDKLDPKSPQLSVEEVLAFGASAIFGLSDELQQQQRELVKLQLDLGAAYRSAATVAADDIDQARRDAAAAEERADSMTRRAAAREKELEAAVLSAHEQLAEAQRIQKAWQRGLERTTAGGRLLEQRITAVREAARAVMAALPSTAAEDAADAATLKAVAQGKPPPAEDPDELALLARALERAGRCTETTRAAAAETALLRAELDAERANAASVRNEHKALVELHRVTQSEKVALKRQLAEALDAKAAAEEAAKRFQALVAVGEQRAVGGGAASNGVPSPAPVGSPPTAPPPGGAMGSAGPTSPPGTLPTFALARMVGSPAGAPSHAAAAAAAVDGLEAAVQEAARLTALLSTPA